MHGLGSTISAILTGGRLLHRHHCIFSLHRILNTWPSTRRDGKFLIFSDQMVIPLLELSQPRMSLRYHGAEMRRLARLRGCWLPTVKIRRGNCSDYALKINGNTTALKRNWQMVDGVKTLSRFFTVPLTSAGQCSTAMLRYT